MANELTVADLIEKLEKIEDKEQKVVGPDRQELRAMTKRKDDSDSDKYVRLLRHATSAGYLKNRRQVE